MRRPFVAGVHERQQVLLLRRLERARLFHRATHPDDVTDDYQHRGSQQTRS